MQNILLKLLFLVVSLNSTLENSQGTNPNGGKYTSPMKVIEFLYPNPDFRKSEETEKSPNYKIVRVKESNLEDLKKNNVNILKEFIDQTETLNKTEETLNKTEETLKKTEDELKTIKNQLYKSEKATANLRRVVKEFYKQKDVFAQENQKITLKQKEDEIKYHSKIDQLQEKFQLQKGEFHAETKKSHEEQLRLKNDVHKKELRRQNDEHEKELRLQNDGHEEEVLRQNDACEEKLRNQNYEHEEKLREQKVKLHNKKVEFIAQKKQNEKQTNEITYFAGYNGMLKNKIALLTQELHNKPKPHEKSISHQTVDFLSKNRYIIGSIYLLTLMFFIFRHFYIILFTQNI